MKTKTLLSWGLRLVVAIILLQTLFFKFAGAEESVYIFSTLGIEPWGRIGSGIAELIFAVMLLIPRTAWMGAVGAMGVISGAILAHLTSLGIEIQGDGGTLFWLAVTVFAGSLGILFLHREEAIAFVKKTLAPKGA